MGVFGRVEINVPVISSIFFHLLLYSVKHSDMVCILLLCKEDNKDKGVWNYGIVFVCIHIVFLLVVAYTALVI